MHRASVSSCRPKARAIQLAPPTANRLAMAVISTVMVYATDTAAVCSGSFSSPTK